MLKLFYSFLLHQVDEAGQPTLDWGVLAESLNKLDAGVPESVGWAWTLGGWRYCGRHGDNDC